MNTDQVKEQLGHIFEEILIGEIISEGTYRSFAEGDELMQAGQEIKYFPVVLSGSLKVMTEYKNGSELLLYYLEAGDTCAMTLQCCLAGSKSSVRVIAEAPSEVMLVPLQRLEEWVVKFHSWRRFIFQSYHERFSEMLDAINDLAFNDLQGRLYKYLKDKAVVNSDPVLAVTQSQIAVELNTSRVVINRLMKKLEQQGLITHDRNTVKVLKFTA